MPDFKKAIYAGTCLCGHSYEDHHLGMVLNPEAHRTAAVAELCRELDQRAMCFPGSRLRLRYAIAEAA